MVRAHARLRPGLEPGQGSRRRAQRAKVWLESELGKGTTVYMALPALT